MIVKRTGFSRGINNARGTIKYLFYGRSHHLNKPKHSNPAGVRNLVIDGIGINTRSYQTAFQDMAYFMRHDTGSKRKLLNLVLAFNVNEFPKDSFDRQNSIWALNLDLLAKNFVQTAFGKNHQALICVQNDTKNQVDVHCHMAVNMTNVVTFKSMPGSAYNLPRLKRVAARKVSQFNQEHGTNLSTGVTKQLTPSQRTELNIIRLIIGSNRITGVKSFKLALAKHHIKLNYHHTGDSLRHGKQFKRPGMSFDYYPRGPIRPGYSYHVSLSTLAKKANDPNLSLRRFIHQFRLNQLLKKQKISDYEEALKTNSVTKLESVQHDSPSNEQQKQAQKRLKRLRTFNHGPEI